MKIWWRRMWRWISLSKKWRIWRRIKVKNIMSIWDEWKTHVIWKTFIWLLLKACEARGIARSLEQREGRNFENLGISKQGVAVPVLIDQIAAYPRKNTSFSVCGSKQNKIFRSRGTLRPTPPPPTSYVPVWSPVYIYI
jgi:hypothetical protein